MKYDRKSWNGVPVSEAIKKARVAAGLTQKDLADKLGYVELVVEEWETGMREPAVASFLAVLEICSTSLEELFGSGRIDALPEESIKIARWYSQLSEESQTFIRGTVEHELRVYEQMRRMKLI